MILVFLFFLKCIFANKRFNEISNERMSNKFFEKVGQQNNFGQPRFNASCDDKSLDAADECEERTSFLI